MSGVMKLDFNRQPTFDKYFNCFDTKTILFDLIPETAKQHSCFRLQFCQTSFFQVLQWKEKVRPNVIYTDIFNQ